MWPWILWKVLTTQDLLLLAHEVQTKTLPLQIQTKRLSLSQTHKSKSESYQLSSEQIGYCFTMTELDIAKSLDSHFPSDRALPMRDIMTSYFSYDLGIKARPIPNTDVHEFSVEIVKNKIDTVEPDGQGELFGTKFEKLFDEKAPDEHGAKFDNSAEKIKD